MSKGRFPHLFEPLRVGQKTMRNRVVQAPMSVSYADEKGHVTQREIEHYGQRAQGVVGMVITANFAISEAGRQLPKTVYLLTYLNEGVTYETGNFVLRESSGGGAPVGLTELTEKLSGGLEDVAHRCPGAALNRPLSALPALLRPPHPPSRTAPPQREYKNRV